MLINSNVFQNDHIFLACKVIPYKKPKVISEANLVAELYRQCCRYNINCVLEYSYEKCRFDAVIVYDGFIVALIEVKSLAEYEELDCQTDQIKKYLKYNLPLFVIAHKRDIKNTVENLRVLRDFCKAKAKEDKKLSAVQKERVEQIDDYLKSLQKK